MESSSEKPSLGPMPICFLLGAAAGLLFAATHDWVDDDYLIGLWTPALILVTLLQFSWGLGRARERLSLALGATLVWGLPLWWIILRATGGGEGDVGESERYATYAFALCLVMLLAPALTRTLLREGRPRGSGWLDRFYTSFILDLSENLFHYVTAVVFLGLFWLLIWLWAELFSLVGVEWFKDVFSSGAFIWFALPSVFGLGLGLARSRSNIMHSLREVLTMACRLLLPLASLLVCVFLPTLLVTGFAPLWATNMGGVIVLTTQALLLLLLNGAVLERRRLPFDFRVAWLIRAAVLALPLLTGLAGWALWLRIGQYGLTPTRIWAVASAIVLGLASLGAAAAVLGEAAGREKELSWLGRSNLAAVGLFLVLSVLTHSPALDPLRLSAEQQYGRLLSGKADLSSFDFWELREGYGRYGQARFKELRALVESGDYPPSLADKGEELARRVRNVNAPGSADAEPRLEDMELRGLDRLPQEVFECYREMAPTLGATPGKTIVWMGDVDRDGGMEYLFFSPGNWAIEVLGARDGRWTRVGQYGPAPDRETLLRALDEGTVVMARPRYDALSVNGSELSFTEW